MMPARRSCGISASARVTSAQSWVPLLPCSGHADFAQFQIGQARGLGPDGGGGGIGQARAVAHLHAVGPVEHQQGDVPQALPCLAHQHGPCEPGEQHGEGSRAQPGAARAAHEAERANGGAGEQEYRQRPEWQGGGEAEGGEDLCHRVILPRRGVRRLGCGRIGRIFFF